MKTTIIMTTPIFRLMLASGRQTMIEQLFFPLWFLLGKKPPINSKERTAAFLSRCLGPIAHRGGIPENTLDAIRESEQNGAVAIEVDLAFTKDGHPVLLHDSTVDRTSNGSGEIVTLKLEDVQRLDFGAHAGIQFSGAKIPILSETMALIDSLNMQMFLEVKSDYKQAVPVVVNMFANNRRLYEKVAVISFYPNFLLELRKKDPDIVTGLLARGTHLAYQADGQRCYKYLHHVVSLVDKILFRWLTGWVWRMLGVGMVMPHKEDILKGRIDVEAYRRQGIGVVTWTVNRQEEKEHFQNVLKIPFITDHVVGQSTNELW